MEDDAISVFPHLRAQSLPWNDSGGEAGLKFMYIVVVVLVIVVAYLNLLELGSIITSPSLDDMTSGEAERTEPMKDRLVETRHLETYFHYSHFSYHFLVYLPPNFRVNNNKPWQTWNQYEEDSNLHFPVYRELPANKQIFHKTV